MRKLLFLMVFVGLLFSSCQKRKQIYRPTSDDFESLTGKGLPAWEFVQTKEDFEYLRLFKAMYDLRKGLMGLENEGIRIPKVVHFIWLGPKPFPRESVENVRSWVAKHPDWTFNFWTDRQRPTPVPGMQTRMVQEFNFAQLWDCFARSANYGEKSDLLRYEILCQEGGVYVDHDVKCYKSFEMLNKAYDFYCGIDMPSTSSLPSCVFTTNNLIGVRPGHPIVKHCMEMVYEKWDQIDRDYPGTDRDAVLNRVLHRTFWLFGESVSQFGNQNGSRDIVFPAYYFDAPKEELAIYARHQYAGSWHERETPFEKMVRERLMILTKKSNRIMLLIGVLSGIQILGLVFLYRLLCRAYGRSGVG
jgi:Glycosyltransferase sugar-binding region containing DXD motif